MVASCIVVKVTRRSLGALCAALVLHAERLDILLKLSWPDAEKIQDKIYELVDTLMVHGVDQKCFSAFAQVEGAEEMVTTQEICVVSLGWFVLRFCNTF
jgi:hypothetical protein